MSKENNDFDEYQREAMKKAFYPRDLGLAYLYPALKLNGEAGEVAEKVAKVFRDELGHFTVESKQAIKKELGDVLWYVSALANELGFKLSDVAACNLEKLNSRAERGVLKGSGDDR